MLVTAIIFVLLVAVDQLTKYWATTCLQPVVDMPLWDGVLHLHYGRNTGAAFSMLSGGGARWFFIIVTLVVVVLVGWYLVREYKRLPTLMRGALTLLLGGAVGNLIDRIAFGYVVDFLYVKIIDFPIFNFADSCITVSAVLLAICFFRYGDTLFPDEKKGAKAAAQAANEDGPAHD